MGRVYEKWHICKCLVFHAENLVKVYTQKNSGYTKSRRKIRQQKIPKINSKFLHIEVLSREAWASKDTRFLTLSRLSVLCVWLFSDCYLQIMNMNYCLAFAFRTKEWEILYDCIILDLESGFTKANRA